mgnify:CR=1 FL=1
MLGRRRREQAARAELAMLTALSAVEQALTALTRGDYGTAEDDLYRAHRRLMRGLGADPVDAAIRDAVEVVRGG